MPIWRPPGGGRPLGLVSLRIAVEVVDGEDEGIESGPRHAEFDELEDRISFGTPPDHRRRTLVVLDGGQRTRRQADPAEPRAGIDVYVLFNPGFASAMPLVARAGVPIISVM
jgi:hypothetical protein